MGPLQRASASESSARSGGRTARQGAEAPSRGAGRGYGQHSLALGGLCPTLSGRRPPAEVTDPPHNLMERKELSSPLGSVQQGVAVGEVGGPVRAPEQHPAEPDWDPGLCD